ncbi:MAG: cache domain-containing protein, partial [Thermodesulfobacteriota bacterium]|nr:cache domain-containing protein [Thermodesulfobacteriota bacterium]
MHGKRLSQIVHGFLAKWLLLPLLAALVCGFIVWSYLNINNLEQDQKFYTRTVGNHVQDYLRNCNWYLQHFTHYFQEPAPTLANKDFLGASSPFQAIYVLDMQGQTLQTLPGKAFKCNFSGIITNYSPGKSFNLTVPYFSRFSNEIVVGMIKSMPGDRLLLAELNLAKLQDSVLHFTRHMQKGMVYLTDAYGNLLAHPDMKLVNQQVNKADLQAIEEAQKNKVRSNYYRLDGDWKLMSSSKLLDSHWIIVVQQDLFPLFAPALLLAVSFLAALLAFLGLVTFIFDRKLQVQVVTPLAA